MKIKTCDGCGKEGSLWKARTKTQKGLCKSCALKQSSTTSAVQDTIEFIEGLKKDIKSVKPRTKINSKSDKQKKIDAAYSVLRPQFLKSRPYCEARLEGCTTMAVSVHHQYMGSNKRKHYLNTLTWTPICQNCHTVCHDKLSTEEQIEKGLRILD